MRPARHVQHHRSDYIPPRPDPRGEIDAVGDMVIHSPFGRAAADTRAVTEKQIPAVSRNVHVQSPRAGLRRQLKCPAKQPNLIVRRRGPFRQRSSMRALG